MERILKNDLQLALDKAEPNGCKILISGGAGFIGSWIARACVAQGYNVVVIDNLARGKESSIPKGVRFYNVDIRDLTKLNEVVKFEHPQIISHHAGLTLVRDSQNYPEDYLQVNLIGTKNILQAAKETGVRKFIFASSGGAVYGDCQRLPIPEGAPRLPKSRYGETKMWAEDFICNDIHEFEVVVLRYGNVYGVGLDHSVVTTFVHALYNGGNPLVYGNGNQIRDYVYITDVVQVNMMAMGEGVTGVFNIASNKGYSTLDVYKKISLAMKVDKKPIHLPNNDYEVEQNVLDIQKVKKDLGWEPLVEFDEGISLTVKKILD